MYSKLLCETECWKGENKLYLNHYKSYRNFVYKSYYLKIIMRLIFDNFHLNDRFSFIKVTQRYIQEDQMHIRKCFKIHYYLFGQRNTTFSQKRNLHIFKNKCVRKQ